MSDHAELPILACSLDALNWLGIIGLIGLFGLKRGHDEDGYHPSDVE